MLEPEHYNFRKSTSLHRTFFLIFKFKGIPKMQPLPHDGAAPSPYLHPHRVNLCFRKACQPRGLCFTLRPMCSGWQRKHRLCPLRGCTCALCLSRQVGLLGALGGVQSTVTCTVSHSHERFVLRVSVTMFVVLRCKHGVGCLCARVCHL